MPLLPVVLVATLLVGLFGAVRGLRDRAPGRGCCCGGAALQALLLVQAALAVVRLLGDGDPPPSVGTYAGYLLLWVLLLPGASRSWSRSAPATAAWCSAAGCLVVAVVELRLQATS